MIPIITLDKSELQAIVLLKRMPEFKIFYDVLKRSMNLLCVAGVSIKEETQTRWNQGRAQELIDIVTKINTADEELPRFKEKARQHVE